MLINKNKNKNKINNYIFYSLFLLSICFNQSSVLANKSDNFSNVKILQLKNKISEDNDKLSKLDQEIQKLDTLISDRALRINKFNATIEKIIKTKLSLQTKKTFQYETLSLQQNQLVKQLQATYVLHRNSNLKILTQANNIQQLNRLLNYIDSFNKLSTNQITQIKESILKIEELDKNLDLLTIEQKQFKQKVDTEYAQLKKLKTDNFGVKQELIASLNKNKSSLKFYESTERKINNTISRNDTNYKIDPNSPFAKLRGKLPLPVDGEIDSEFKHFDSRQAVFIKTTEGQKVKSVFDGKVVFSNWMRGFGFLTIVNHGNGYMSLYGHNQSLLKKPGDKIKAGEAIAISGNSGNTIQPGVYFEIRHNGNTLNPLAWLDSEGDRQKNRLA